MDLGFHADAFNSAYFSFEACLEWAQRNDVQYIECGLIDGVSWIHGLGYQPHVALWEDPVLLRAKMDRYGVQFSQVDAANIRQCLGLLRDHGYDGVLSIECEGQGGPMIEQSLQRLRKTLAELALPERVEPQRLSGNLT